MGRRRTTPLPVAPPKYEKYLEQGYRPIKEYDMFVVFEKVVHGEVLYRESFHKFDLYGAEWARSVRKEQ